eukprot:TRINITY_DN3012_c0_g1_i1.p1 TRINITY_DN3012_c0_g1~~TRINITY_DN3012_c0_g1_i1.p1  ORF type:complete len:240 (-),score=51.62 TRINITY_DN3012_c0_g1_i1:446-1165(-)
MGIKVEKKAKYLQECINQLKKQLQQEMQSGDGSNTEHLSEKLKEKEVELEEFLEKCSEYDPNSNCDVEIPTESKTVEEDLNDNDNDDSVSKLNQEDQEAIKKDSQELSNINDGPKTKEQVLVTHDGQEIEMEVPDELEFLQIRKKKFKKIQKKSPVKLIIISKKLFQLFTFVLFKGIVFNLLFLFNQNFGMLGFIKKLLCTLGGSNPNIFQIFPLKINATKIQRNIYEQSVKSSPSNPL